MGIHINAWVLTFPQELLISANAEPDPPVTDNGLALSVAAAQSVTGFVLHVRPPERGADGEREEKRFSVSV